MRKKAPFAEKPLLARSSVGLVHAGLLRLINLHEAMGDDEAL